MAEPPAIDKVLKLYDRLEAAKKDHDLEGRAIKTIQERLKHHQVDKAAVEQLKILEQTLKVATQSIVSSAPLTLFVLISTSDDLQDVFDKASKEIRGKLTEDIEAMKNAPGVRKVLDELEEGDY